MQQPHVAEAALVKEPVTALTQRLRQLLMDWPENPLLEQLIALCNRLLGASPTSRIGKFDVRRYKIMPSDTWRNNDTVCRSFYCHVCRCFWCHSGAQPSEL